MKYKVGSKVPGSRFLDIEITIETKSKNAIEIALPCWRPGRYELGNFAKNIRGFKAISTEGKELKFEKQSTHLWRIECNQEAVITVIYQYYTTELNAGSSWVDKNQLYINPVNCLMYVPSKQEEPCELSFDIPDDYMIATGMKKEHDTFVTSCFDELADSPAICSPTLQHNSYEVNGTQFHIWFQGKLKANWTKLIADFTSFTKTQWQSMVSFPFDEYHFLFQILPYTAYHGVEHLNSTVISLGPSKEVMKTKLYDELLGVSSHELFHAWNVKTIRPADMLPYDFSKENYTKMGYLTEGVTTYLGDLFLVKSGVFDLNKYINEVQQLLDRHSFNYGRYNYSVCESSFDTWLDGYVKGIPNRKTSIYTEGALLAMYIDIMLIHKTNGKSNLESVMKMLFDKYAKKNIGITEQLFIKTIKAHGGDFIEDLFSNYYHKATDYFELLKSAFEKVGLKLKKEKNPSDLAAKFGCYTDKKGKVLLIAPDSPVYSKGINVGDEIKSIDGKKWKEEMHSNKLGTKITLKLSKVSGIEKLTAETIRDQFFNKYCLSQPSKVKSKQRKLLKDWTNSYFTPS